MGTAKANSVATFWLPLHIYHFECGCDIICLINRSLRRTGSVYFDSDTFYYLWYFAFAKSKENA